MADILTNTELQKGNPDAYRELFNCIYPRLKAYCRLFIPENDQADDIIQECFVTLWEKRNTIQAGKSIESYMFVMARNRCLNYLKQKKLEEGIISLNNLKSFELQSLYQLDFAGKEEMALEEMLILSFKRAIEELPEKRKLIFKRCKIEGLKQSEVAEELGITQKAVEKHISKAKQQLRINLAPHFPA